MGVQITRALVLAFGLVGLAGCIGEYAHKFRAGEVATDCHVLVKGLRQSLEDLAPTNGLYRYTLLPVVINEEADDKLTLSCLLKFEIDQEYYFKTYMPRMNAILSSLCKGKFTRIEVKALSEIDEREDKSYDWRGYCQTTDLKVKFDYCAYGPTKKYGLRLWPYFLRPQIEPMRFVFPSGFVAPMEFGKHCDRRREGIDTVPFLVWTRIPTDDEDGEAILYEIPFAEAKEIDAWGYAACNGRIKFELDGLDSEGKKVCPAKGKYGSRDFYCGGYGELSNFWPCPLPGHGVRDEGNPLSCQRMHCLTPFVGGFHPVYLQWFKADFPKEYAERIKGVGLTHVQLELRN